MNKQKVNILLNRYGSLPSKYRLTIWTKLLQLPENQTAFQNLLNKGEHPCFSNLHQTFPIKDRRLFKRLERILSALGYWSNIFCELPYVPALIFPFVKCVDSDLLCFEIVATFLTNWGKEWFSLFPEPPLATLQTIEHLLASQDPALYNHLLKNGIPSELYAWSLLQSIFTEVFSREEWLVIMDHVICRIDSLSFVNAIAVAYGVYFRVHLLKMSNYTEFEAFFHQLNPGINVSNFIALATKISTQQQDTDFVSLPIGSYPVFNNFPADVVQQQIIQHQKIIEEEQNLLKERLNTIKLEEHFAKLLNAQKLALDIEEKLAALQQQRKKQESATSELKEIINNKRKMEHNIKEKRLSVIEKSIDEMLRLQTQKLSLKENNVVQ